MELREFIRESNRIEGIVREPSDTEIAAHQRFLAGELSINALVRLVAAVQPDACLRDRSGLDVRVGTFYPPPGGPLIQTELENLLRDQRDPYWTHHIYETIHPFTDGNGRSGRALWLWMMGGIQNAPLGFLHHWYYQSLRAGTMQLARANPHLDIRLQGMSQG